MEFFRVSLDVIWKLSVQHPYLGYNTEFSAQLPIEQRPKKLLKQVQDVIRLKHYSYQTGKTYIYWIRRYSVSQSYEIHLCSSLSIIKIRNETLSNRVSPKNH